MTDTNRYLGWMVLFLGIGSAVVFFVYPVLIDAFLANPMLNGLILGALLVGIMLNIRQVVVLGPEAKWIERFQDRAEDTEGESLESMRSTVSDNELRLLSPMAKMLAERRGQEKFSLSAPAMRTLLDGIASRLEESRDLSRYFIGLSIFLGLLGTFWGLLATVASVGDVIQNLSLSGEDIVVVFNDLKSGLEAPLGGMGTAFSSSLFGLAGSLILGFLDLQAGQAQNHFYNELEEWLSGVTRLSSGASVGDGDQSVSAYTEALLEKTAESMDELQRILSRGEESRIAANQHFAEMNDKLVILTDQMRTEQQVLAKVAGNQTELQPLLAKLTELAASISTDSDSGFDEATRNHIRNMDSALSRLLVEMSSARDQTVKDIRSEIKLLAKTVQVSPESARGKASPDLSKRDKKDVTGP